MLIVIFREKKSQTRNILLLSTANKAEIATKKIRHKEVTKPKVIFYYNSYMGGVELADKKAYHLAAERSTRRYWKKIFHNLLDIALVNSHILFMELKNPRRDWRRFVIELVEGLCSGQPR